MTQYISKDALIAEIERLRKNQRLDDRHGQGVLDGLHAIERFLDTLKVKEVDLEKELTSMITPELKFHKALPSLFDVAKHFFELGIKANGHFAVYVVTRSEEHDDYVEEVFFDKDKAQEYCDQFKENENAYARHITKVEVTL